MRGRRESTYMPIQQREKNSSELCTTARKFIMGFFWGGGDCNLSLNPHHTIQSSHPIEKNNLVEEN